MNDMESDMMKDMFGISFVRCVALSGLRAGGSAYLAYGATGVPETFLIDREGRLAERFVGPRNWKEPRYARAIRRLLDASGDASMVELAPAGGGGTRG